MNSKEKKWIDIGYTLFAKEGPKGLKVDRMAKTLNTSRSSFYYYFADLEIFKSMLFKYHIERAKLMSEAALQCKNLNPDLLNAILMFKQDLLFNRQLRTHHHLPGYSQCIKEAHDPIENGFLKIWANDLKLENNLGAAKMLLRLVSENFYMRISEDNLNFEWLKQYLVDIMNMTKEIEKSKY